MGSSRSRRASQPAGDALGRDQEVIRATRELAAYFRGRRTEREARGAVKIIKAFIREREKLDPAKRRPLPFGKAVRSVPTQKARLRPTRRPGVRKKSTAPAEPPKSNTPTEPHNSDN